MTEEEREYLEDTWAILIDYGGYRTVEQLKGLIDETKQRISNVLTNQMYVEEE